MSSRFAWIPIGLFLIWCVISQQWYVCGIQKACDTASEPAQTAQAPIAPPPAPIEVPATPAPAPVAPADVPPSEVALSFAKGSTHLTSDAAVDAYLDQLAKQLAQSGDALTITGHTDNTGTPQHNLAVGLRRAANVRDLLIGKGVAGSQIKTLSEGQRQPKASNDTEEGRAQNRRVELHIAPKASHD